MFEDNNMKSNKAFEYSYSSSKTGTFGRNEDTLGGSSSISHDLSRQFD